MKQNKTIRVLMIGPNLRISNGVASFQMNYMRHLSPEDAIFDFAVLEDIPSPYQEEIKANGGHIYILPSLKNLRAHLRFCRTLLRQGQYDVIHDNTLIKSLPMMYCAWRMKIPVRILHCHSSKLSISHIKSAITRALLPGLKACANQEAACSQVAAQMMYPGKKVQLIPNAVDINLFRPDPAVRNAIRSKLGDEHRFVIGAVGRIAPEKNPFFAVDVFEKLLTRMPDARFWWIGTGVLDAPIADYVKSKGLEDRFRLLGNSSEVETFYQGMDLFLMPSLFEGLPLSAVEAQAAGLHCLLSDRITKELALSDKVSYLSLEDGPEVWAEKIAQLRPETEKNRLVPDCTAFNINNCADKLLRFYTAALEHA